MSGVFFAVLAILHGTYLLFLWRGWRAATRWQIEDMETRVLPPVSVIVAVHNEAASLPHLLEALEQQTHPHYEVLLVNDHSDDDTETLARTWQTRWPHLRLLHAPAHGKKAALTAGIQHAQHDLLAFTDADCLPPPRWLERLAAFHARLPESVAVGYGPLLPQSGWLNRLIRFETTMTAFLTAGAIGLQRPFMAVGRNLSYPRSVFKRAGGFASHAHLLSGDDDLFVQEVHRTRAGRVRYLSDPETFVYSPAPTSIHTWIHQKRRHTSAGRHYARDIQLHLALFHLSYATTYLAPLFLGAMGWMLPLGLLGLRWLLVGGRFSFLEVRDLLPWFPLLDGAYMLYLLLIAPIGVLLGSRRW